MYLDCCCFQRTALHNTGISEAHGLRHNTGRGKPPTRDNYSAADLVTPSVATRYTRQLTELPLKCSGWFGDIVLKDISKKVNRINLDAADSPVAANRRIQFLKAVYSWAIQRQKGIEDNLCAGVDPNEEKARTRYIEDWEYEVMFMVAMDSPYPYIALTMQIAYLCRQRNNEVASRRVSEIADRRLITRGGKGSKGGETFWTERLRAAVDAFLALNRGAP